MRGFIKGLVLSSAVALVCAPRPARADGYVNPWAGVNFGSEIANGRGGFGASAGWMGAGIAGAEVNFGYSPSFWGTQNDFGNNTVLDLMGNVILGLPVGGQHGHGFRPYVTAGIGLIRSQVDGGTVFDVQRSDNDFGWNAGVGAMGFFNDHVGLRGDVRYLRNINGDITENLNFSGGNFHFWRTSFGLVIR